jgi:hypothetical protein
MPSETPDVDGMRVAIVSTPRSGNTWLRGLLARVYQLKELAVHRPDEIDWWALPPRCALQIHWKLEVSFVAELARHGFHSVVIARHPLDVLISALNYNYYTHSREECPDPSTCEPCSLLDATPRSEAFLTYACSQSGDGVLTYSRDWWAQDWAHRVRYEDLVERPVEALEGLIGSLGVAIRSPVGEAVELFDLERRRARETVWHYHYWQGRPGLWRSLIPAAEARRIEDAQRSVFEVLGYACDPDESLSDVQADLNWYRVQLESTRKHLRDERAKHRLTRGRLDESARHLDDALQRLEIYQAKLTDAWDKLVATGGEHDAALARAAATERSLAEAHDRLARVEHELVETRARLSTFEDLGARSIAVARGLRRVWRRQAAVVSTLRRMAPGGARLAEPRR